MSIWKLAFRKRLTRHKFYEAEIQKVRKSVHQPIAWSTKEIGVMLETAKNSTCPDFSPACWQSLIMLIYLTGLRISAVLQLKRSDLHGHVLIVPHTIQKDKEDQVFRLSNEMVNMLHALPKPAVIQVRTASGRMITANTTADSSQTAICC
ncbi:hypothetical protein SH661x_001851 [Planctomicrobium sp. SH661]|uniref:hypothetical protein n=1 Tax=Planctomicrobium sp. SH661 TaxID=3448124 RepID=UPI003F5B81D6